MARLGNTATKEQVVEEQVVEVHVAKMAGKRFDRERAYARMLDDRRGFGMFAPSRKTIGLNSIARRNRHTQQPHLNLREIARTKGAL